VINQTNILSILPTPTLGELPMSGDVLGLGDSTFQNFMKDAAQESSQARREDNSVARKEREDQPPAYEQNRVEPKENGPAKGVDPADRDALVSREAKDTSAENYQGSTTTDSTEATGQNVVVPENQPPIEEQLKDLGISPEKIDALLAVLNVEGGVDVNSLLQSLVQTLNLNPENFDLGATADPSVQRQQLLSLLKGQEGQAADLLAKAGLTQQETKDLLGKLQTGQANQQAALNSDKETTDDLLVKLSGERSADGKTDFLSQFSDLNKQQDKPQRQASIEKVLNKIEQEPATDLNLKPLDKALTTAPKLDESMQPNVNQGAPVPPPNLANANPAKTNEGVKAPLDVKVQNVNAVSESQAKPLEGAKAVTAETLSAKGTSEAKVLNQIMNKFSLRTNGSQSEIKIKLDPPSLGTVRMNISTSGDSVRTVVIAENHAVKQIIENNLIQLRESMSAQGLKVDGFTVLVGGDDGQSGQQNKPNEGFSHYADSSNAEKNASSETIADNAEVERTFLGDSQSISVIA
jgi:flagellar hook-length control protein FliK